MTNTNQTRNKVKEFREILHRLAEYYKEDTKVLIHYLKENGLSDVQISRILGVHIASYKQKYTANV